MVREQQKTVAPRNSRALRDLVREVCPSLIVEFGSWEGRSAITLLTEAQSLGLESKIVCVDTWLGSPEMWEGVYPDGTEWSFERLRVRNGEPHVLETFWNTIQTHGFIEQTQIVRASTSNGGHYLKRSGVKPELVYVDADHSFLAVLSDVRLAKSLIKDGGVVAGDDFNWTQVRLAITFFALRGLTVMTSQDQFLLIDSGQSELRKSFLGCGWRVERFLLLRSIPLIFWRIALRAKKAIGDG